MRGSWFVHRRPRVRRCSHGHDDFFAMGIGQTSSALLPASRIRQTKEERVRVGRLMPRPKALAPGLVSLSSVSLGFSPPCLLRFLTPVNAWSAWDPHYYCNNGTATVNPVVPVTPCKNKKDNAVVSLRLSGEKTTLRSIIHLSFYLRRFFEP